MHKAAKTIRIVILSVWIAAVVFCIGGYFLFPSSFTPASIASFLGRFQGEAWLIYIAISALRGFILLPSTPLVLAGALVFPGQAGIVFTISLVGIFLSSTMIYFFSELLGFDEYFEKRRPDVIHKVRTKLEHPLGLLFVAAWAFFPAVPTDLVCYAAGSSRMSYPKFITAVMVGEATLCYFYVFLGGSLLDQMR